MNRAAAGKESTRAEQKGEERNFVVQFALQDGVAWLPLSGMEIGRKRVGRHDDTEMEPLLEEEEGA